MHYHSSPFSVPSLPDPPLQWSILVFRFLCFEFHINDIDHLRIELYKNMTIEEERYKFYNLEKEILKKGSDFIIVL